MTLGLLVGRFGNFVRECHVPSQQAIEPDIAFPASIAHLREAVGHHMIPLVLLARADGDFADSERAVIVKHCLSMAQLKGLEGADGDGPTLSKYLASYRPTLVQLDPALHRLERGTQEEIAALFKTAQTVVDADGERKPEEVRLLAELHDELHAL